MLRPTVMLLARRLGQSRGFASTLPIRYPAPPKDLNDGERDIFTKLDEAFKPSKLAVQDVSGGCGTFYAIEISSQNFKDLSMIKQHQLVNKTLKDDIARIHGLQLKTSVAE